MRRILALPAAALSLAAMPALAQDTGTMYLDSAASYANVVAMNSYLPHNNGSTSTPRAAAKGSPERSRQTCANARKMARAGDSRPKLGQLLQLCRMGGY